MHYALLAAALAIGCLLAVQASVNLQLNKAVGTPYGASTVQLSVATALLVLLGVALGVLGALGKLPDATWWHLVAGLASPLYITSGILLFPRLGALLAVALFVTGQMFASLGLDLLGLIGVPKRPVSVTIVLGAVAVLAGITTIVRAQKPPAPKPEPATQLAGTGARSGATPPPAGPPSSGGGAPAPAPAPSAAGAARLGWLLLGLVAGAVLPIQGAINAKLRGDLGEPLAVGVVSFAVATLTISIVLLVLRATGRTARPDFANLRTVPWWGWLGGACAAAYVVATFMLLPKIGAATTIALTVTGQQLASALIDHFGAFRMVRRPMIAARLAGLLVLVVGCLLVQLG